MPPLLETLDRRAVFFDRDGTLNVEKNYLYLREDWEWLPGAIEAIRSANELGFEVVVVTNQAGIARGLYSENDLARLHSWVSADLAKFGARVDAYYYCPHHPDFTGPCECRKPQPGLLRQAAKERGIDLSNSYLVGDKFSDVQAALAAGCLPILVASGYGEVARSELTSQVPYLASLLDFPHLLHQLSLKSSATG